MLSNMLHLEPQEAANCQQHFSAFAMAIDKIGDRGELVYFRRQVRNEFYEDAQKVFVARVVYSFRHLGEANIMKIVKAITDKPIMEVAVLQYNVAACQTVIQEIHDQFFPSLPESPPSSQQEMTTKPKFGTPIAVKVVENPWHKGSSAVVGAPASAPWNTVTAADLELSQASQARIAGQKRNRDEAQGDVPATKPQQRAPEVPKHVDVPMHVLKAAYPKLAEDAQRANLMHLREKFFSLTDEYFKPESKTYYVAFRESFAFVEHNALIDNASPFRRRALVASRCIHVVHVSAETTWVLLEPALDETSRFP